MFSKLIPVLVLVAAAGAIAGQVETGGKTQELKLPFCGT
jgi:hypothetical protein